VLLFAAVRTVDQWRVLREYCSALLPHSSLVCRVRTRPIVSSAEYRNAIPTARWFDRD
jgi:hypothetical protein